MSMTLVKPYFKARAEAVGLTEHRDPFNIENIPSSLIHGSFQVGFFRSTLRQQNQNDLEMDMPCEVVFYFKGYRDPMQGFDEAIIKAEALVKECLVPANRLGTCLKNVEFLEMQIEPIAVSNDNLIRTRVSFNVITSLAI